MTPEAGAPSLTGSGQRPDGGWQPHPIAVTLDPPSTPDPPPPGPLDRMGRQPPRPSAAPAGGQGIVEAHSLSKRYRSSVAVSDVTLTIGSGVSGLLGPNGAGKSTLLRLLGGLTKPSRGIVRVNGGDPRASVEARSAIGFVPDHDGVFPESTVRQFLHMTAVLSGVDQPGTAIDNVAELLAIDRVLGKPIGTLSKGYKQRAKIAAALIHDPDVVLLDEPFNGLDPRQRRSMIELFTSLAVNGKVVLVSSHVLAEVEEFCSDILVVVRGRLIAKGNFRDLRRMMSDEPLRYRVVVDQPARLASELVALGLLADLSIRQERLEVSTFRPDEFREGLITICSQSGLLLRELEPRDEDIESVFRRLAG